MSRDKFLYDMQSDRLASYRHGVLDGRKEVISTMDIDAQLHDIDAQLQDKDAQLRDIDAQLQDKDAQIAELKELLAKKK
jgi:uncharacterized protein (DUF3084 family)